MKYLLLISHGEFSIGLKTGGSPLTTACKVLDELGKFEDAIILSGMNLPMAITSAVMKDMLDGENFVNAVLSEAQSALQEFKITLGNEDDDI